MIAFLIRRFSGGDSSEEICFLLVQHGDQPQLLSECNPNILDSAKGSDIPSLFLFEELSTLVPNVLSLEPS